MHGIEGTTFPELNTGGVIELPTDQEIDAEISEMMAGIQRTFANLGLEIDINIELGDDTTDQEIDEIIAGIEEHVNRLRGGTFYLN